MGAYAHSDHVSSRLCYRHGAPHRRWAKQFRQTRVWGITCTPQTFSRLDVRRRSDRHSRILCRAFANVAATTSFVSVQLLGRTLSEGTLGWLAVKLKVKWSCLYRQNSSRAHSSVEFQRIPVDDVKRRRGSFSPRIYTPNYITVSANGKCRIILPDLQPEQFSRISIPMTGFAPDRSFRLTAMRSPL